MLILLQAVSGLVLSIEWLLGFHARVGAMIDASRVPEGVQVWDWLFVNVHYGGGKAGALYHAVLALGLIWLVVTGFAINHRVQQRLRQMEEKKKRQEKRPGPPSGEGRGDLQKGGEVAPPPACRVTSVPEVARQGRGPCQAVDARTG